MNMLIYVNQTTSYSYLYHSKNRNIVMTKSMLFQLNVVLSNSQGTDV